MGKASLVMTISIGAGILGCDEPKLHSRSRPFPVAAKVLLSMRDDSDDANIVFLDPSSCELRTVTTGPGFKSDAAASPDGMSIVYAVRSGNSATQLYSIQRDGTDQRRLSDNRFSDALPSYLPHGHSLIFARAARQRPYSMGGMAWDDWDVWLMDADGGNERRLTDMRLYELSAPQVSPDGRSMVFSADTGDANTGSRIYIGVLADDAQAAGQPPPLPLPPTPPNTFTADIDPAFSPDGGTIVFISNRVSRPSPYDYEVWLVNIDGTSLRQVTRNRSLNQSPAFSPDGKSIYFLSDPQRDGSFELWRVSREGTGAMKLCPK